MKDYWGPDKRCIHCGAGNDAHHSYTCPTNMHPDKREPTKPVGQCSHCLRTGDECDCSDADVAADMGDK